MIHLDYKKFFKYSFYTIILIWIIITIHIFFIYIQSQNTKIPFKGGTIVEGGNKKINFLPYTSIYDDDKFYQSLLFRACVKPFVSGTQILLQEDLCKIETTNYKTFKVYLEKNNLWSNGNPITLEDIYFTFNDILKNNRLNLPSIPKEYNKIQINFKNDYIEVDFPEPTINNQNFFTNFILPKDILEDKDLNWYLNEYPKNLTNNNCGTLKLNQKDPNSVIFDLSKCNNFYIKNYQYKYFDNIDKIKEFNEKNKKIIIDYYINDKTLSGYKKEKIILNNYLVIFFNSNSENIDIKFKQAFLNDLLGKILTGFEYQNFVKVLDYFQYKPKNYSLNNWFKNNNTLIKKILNIPNLPRQIQLNIKQEQIFYLKNIENRFTLNFVLPNTCDKVGIQYENQNIYYLKSFKPGNLTAIYNLSPKFNNIKAGKNIYTIYCEKNGKNIFKHPIIIYYKTKPTQTIKKSKNIKIKIVYYQDKTNEELIKYIKSYLKKNNLINYFKFESFKTDAEKNGILQGNNYDILIQGIYLGIKKDISNVFKSSNPNINPSQYQNIDFANKLQQYFISKGKTKKLLKEEIQKTFHQNLPLIFIGKYLDTYNVRENLNFSFPKRLYNWRLRGDPLEDLVIIYKSSITLKQIFNFQNFKKFILNNL